VFHIDLHHPPDISVPAYRYNFSFDSFFVVVVSMTLIKEYATSAPLPPLTRYMIYLVEGSKALESASSINLILATGL
jgi:hypothetical protein